MSDTGVLSWDAIAKMGANTSAMPAGPAKVVAGTTTALAAPVLGLAGLVEGAAGLGWQGLKTVGQGVGGALGVGGAPAAPAPRTLPDVAYAPGALPQNQIMGPNLRATPTYTPEQVAALAQRDAQRDAQGRAMADMQARMDAGRKAAIAANGGDPTTGMNLAQRQMYAAGTPKQSEVAARQLLSAANTNRAAETARIGALPGADQRAAMTAVNQDWWNRLTQIAGAPQLQTLAGLQNTGGMR